MEIIIYGERAGRVRAEDLKQRFKEIKQRDTKAESIVVEMFIEQCLFNLTVYHLQCIYQILTLGEVLAQNFQPLCPRARQIPGGQPMPPAAECCPHASSGTRKAWKVFTSNAIPSLVVLYYINYSTMNGLSLQEIICVCRRVLLDRRYD